MTAPRWIRQFRKTPHSDRPWTLSTASFLVALVSILSFASAPLAGKESEQPGSRAEPLSTAMPSHRRDPKAVAAISMDVSRSSAPADGLSRVTVSLRLFDRNGDRVLQDTMLTVENTGGQLRLIGAPTDVDGPRGGDADSMTPGTQILVTQGKALLRVIAPSDPQQVIVRASTDRLSTDTQISFVPQLRDWIAVGLIEGIIALRRSDESGVNQVRANDGFERELRQFERRFNSGRGRAAARAAFFVKGTIKGKYLLSASYDSDKETRARMLRDIRAEQIYPIYGDASIKGFEARSGSKLFVRISRDKNYLLFGDFTTVSGTATAVLGNHAGTARRVDLGANNRSLTGGKLHLESERGQLDVYAVRDNLRSKVDEIVPNGTSGPYGLSSNQAIENTERVELVVRSRSQPGQIVEIRLLQRFVDYTFEPFAGRLLFKSPINRSDEFGNLQSIRVTYEQQDGAEKVWHAGAQGELKFSESLTIGAGASHIDRDTTTSTQGEVTDLASVNVGVKLGQSTSLVAEAARSESIAANPNGTASNLSGNAYRVKIQTKSPSGIWSASAHAAKTDQGFVNPSASIERGRSEIGAAAQAELTSTIGVRAEVQQSSDETNDAKGKGAYLGLTVTPSDRWKFSAGIRYIDDNGNGLLNPISIGSNGSVFSGNGLTTSGGGLFGDGAGSINPSNGNPIGSSTLSGTALNTNTVQLGAAWQASEKLRLGAEVEKSYRGDDAWRAATRASWALGKRTDLNARYELQTGLGGYYDRTEKSRALVFGISRGFLENGKGYAEYRLRDAQAGREAQLAHGLRNTFAVGAGWRALASLERVAILSGVNRQATAVALGADYPGAELWKAAARIEARRLHDNPATAVDDPSDSLLITLSAARKLSRAWTGLSRVYTLHSDDQSLPGIQSQTRLQVGAAYRPVDHNRFDALGKFEYRHERNTELTEQEHRKVWVAAMHGNWHPSRPWWVSGRFAAKRVNETLAGVRDSYSAWLVGGRVIYDLTEKWDLGLMASVLGSPNGGTRQWATGLETGYTLQSNLWLSVGFNWRGFSDRDLTGSDYTAQGAFVRLRYKFDEDIFRGALPAVNRARPREE